jgi:two-component system, NarL family, response regulator LiaR
LSGAIRVLTADDHDLVRRGLQALFEITAGIELVGEAVDGMDAVEKVRQLQPDVILLDLMMPRMDGIEAIRAIRAENPNARILVLTSFAEDDQVFAAVKSGALGYLLKDSSPDDLLQAIRDVYRGEPSLQPAIARKLLREISRPVDRGVIVDPLTDREIEVLKLVARGFSNQEIADGLVISEGTVRFHVSNILDKLHLANRTQAALYALREGFASLDDRGPGID